jgi:hypothetical protein
MTQSTGGQIAIAVGGLSEKQSSTAMISISHPDALSACARLLASLLNDSQSLNTGVTIPSLTTKRIKEKVPFLLGLTRPTTPSAWIAHRCTHIAHTREAAATLVPIRQVAVFQILGSRIKFVNGWNSSDVNKT